MTKFSASWLPLHHDTSMCHFSSEEYLAYIKFPKKISFSYTVGKKVVLIVFAQTGQFEWTSLPNSTFGGFVINQAISGDALIKFVDQIEEWFMQNTDARVLKINLPPNGTGYSFADYQFYCLYLKDYLINLCNLSYSVKICKLNFDELISYGNLKRIKKCENQNFNASEVNINKISAVYKVISSNRRLKGYPMTLSLESLEEQANLFTDKFRLFCVENDGVMVAAAVTVMLTPGTLYVLYWGDILEFRSYSPIVFLCKKIYQYCQDNNLKYLDIGTATIDKEPNYGLMDFKSDLGFTPNLKFSMQKSIRI